MTEYFDMSLTFDDIKIVKEVVNQGIDSRLEGFVKSIFLHEVVDSVIRLQCKIHPDEMSILLRRLEELETEQAEMLADDITTIQYDIEINEYRCPDCDNKGHFIDYAYNRKFTRLCGLCKKD